MPDSKENAAVYAHAPQQKPGCGFPLMPVLGLFDLNGGTWITAVKSKPRAHDAHLAWRMLKHLRAGDILLADRAFGSYAFIAACQARGVDVVMRLHQARDAGRFWSPEHQNAVHAGRTEGGLDVVQDLEPQDLLAETESALRTLAVEPSTLDAAGAA